MSEVLDTAAAETFGPLPESWATVPLSAVVEAVPNTRPESEPTREFGYIDISAIDNRSFRVVDSDIRKFRGADAPSRARRPIRSGDVLFSNVRTNLRNVALVQPGTPAQLCSTGFTVLRPTRAVHPRYMLRWVLSDAFIAAVTPQQTGTHYPATSDRIVLSQAIRLPPIAEQHRIVEKVETLLAQLDAARERLARVPSILRRFRQAVLAAACSGRLTEDWRATNTSQPVTLPDDEVLGDSRPDATPSTWAWVPLGTIASRVTDGTHQPPPLASSGVPFLLIGNIVKGRIDWGAISKWVTNETYRRLTARCRPERDDVLYTAVGATFGQALGVDWDHPFVFQRHIAHIKPRHALVHTRFLVIALSSPSTYALATEVARGAAQPTVTLGDLKRFPVPVPPLAEQAEIVRRVDNLLTVADAVERRLVAARRRADMLPQAILARAFSGELVATEAELARAEGRDYEPTSVLLERIRVSRATLSPPRAARRRTRGSAQGRRAGRRAAQR